MNKETPCQCDVCRKRRDYENSQNGRLEEATLEALEVEAIQLIDELAGSQGRKAGAADVIAVLLKVAGRVAIKRQMHVVQFSELAGISFCDALNRSVHK